MAGIGDFFLLRNHELDWWPHSPLLPSKEGPLTMTNSEALKELKVVLSWLDDNNQEMAERLWNVIITLLNNQEDDVT